MSDKLWSCITHEEQKFRKRGGIVTPDIIPAPTRREAKIKFREAHPLHTERGTYYWNLSQIIASPMKEEE